MLATPKVIPATVTAYTIVKDGFLPGFLPAYRVVCVKVDSNGKASVEASQQKYVIGEAQAILDDRIRENLSL